MSDISTLGVTLKYAPEATAGERPTTGYTQLPRCKSIGGVALTPEKIDTSCLEDLVSQYAPGRADTGGDWPLVFHSGGMDAIKTMLSTYAALTGGKDMWFAVCFPSLADAYYVKAAPPAKLALGDISDNSPLEIPVNMTLEEIEGYATAPTAA